MVFLSGAADENFYLPYMAKPGMHLKAAASDFKNAKSLFLSQKGVENPPLCLPASGLYLRS